MKTNAGITIFHEGYDEITRTEKWEKTYFSNVSCQNNTKVAVLNDGLKSDNIINIRIPTIVAINISNGDKVVIGNASSSAKPPNNAYTIIGFADNRKGSRNLWHWKVMCK